MDIEHIERRATLAVVGERPEHAFFHRQVEIGVLQHDACVLGLQAEHAAKPVRLGVLVLEDIRDATRTDERQDVDRTAGTVMHPRRLPASRSLRCRCGRVLPSSLMLPAQSEKCPPPRRTAALPIQAAESGSVRPFLSSLSVRSGISPPCCGGSLMAHRSASFVSWEQ